MRSFGCCLLRALLLALHVRTDFIDLDRFQSQNSVRGLRTKFAFFGIVILRRVFPCLCVLVVEHIAKLTYETIVNSSYLLFGFREVISVSKAEGKKLKKCISATPWYFVFSNTF